MTPDVSKCLLGMEWVGGWKLLLLRKIGEKMEVKKMLIDLQPAHPPAPTM